MNTCINVHVDFIYQCFRTMFLVGVRMSSESGKEKLNLVKKIQYCVTANNTHYKIYIQLIKH